MSRFEIIFGVFLLLQRQEGWSVLKKRGCFQNLQNVLLLLAFLFGVSWGCKSGVPPQKDSTSATSTRVFSPPISAKNFQKTISPTPQKKKKKKKPKTFHAFLQSSNPYGPPQLLWKVHGGIQLQSLFLNLYRFEDYQRGLEPYLVIMGLEKCRSLDLTKRQPGLKYYCKSSFPLNLPEGRYILVFVGQSQRGSFLEKLEFQVKGKP